MLTLVRLFVRWHYDLCYSLGEILNSQIFMKFYRNFQQTVEKLHIQYFDFDFKSFLGNFDLILSLFCAKITLKPKCTLFLFTLV